MSYTDLAEDYIDAQYDGHPSMHEEYPPERYDQEEYSWFLDPLDAPEDPSEREE